MSDSESSEGDAVGEVVTEEELAKVTGLDMTMGSRSVLPYRLYIYI